MAREDDDIDALLAEVDRSLSGGRAPAARAKPGSPSPAVHGGASAELVRRIRVGGLSAAVAAAVVFALFAVTPFLGAVSGAAGAALTAFVLVLVLPRRR